MKRRVVLVLAALFTACANGQTPQGVLRGYIATGYDLPAQHSDPIQSRVTPNGKYLVYQGDNTTTGEQAQYVKCLNCQDTSWQSIGLASSFASAHDPNPADKRFRGHDPGDPNPNSVTISPLTVTNDYMFVTINGLTGDGRFWYPRESVAVSLSTLQRYPLVSLYEQTAFRHLDGHETMVWTAANYAGFTVGSDGMLYTTHIMSSAWQGQDAFCLIKLSPHGGTLINITPTEIAEQHTTMFNVWAVGDHLLLHTMDPPNVARYARHGRRSDRSAVGCGGPGCSLGGQRAEVGKSGVGKLPSRKIDE